jgi:hypothetical protein
MSSTSHFISHWTLTWCVRLSIAAISANIANIGSLRRLSLVPMSLAKSGEIYAVYLRRLGADMQDPRIRFIFFPPCFFPSKFAVLNGRQNI